MEFRDRVMPPASDPDAPQDERSAARFPLALATTVTKSNGPKAEAVLLDISQNGCLFISDASFAIGQEITVRLGEPVEPIRGSVAWQGHGFYGCHFALPLSQACLDALRVKGLPRGMLAGEDYSRVTVGEKLAAARKSIGCSATQLAQELKVSRPTLWAWETGRTEPSHDNLDRVEKWIESTEKPRRSTVRSDRSSQIEVSTLESLVERHRTELANELSIQPERIKISIEF